jgi:hypothetical protein
VLVRAPKLAAPLSLVDNADMPLSASRNTLGADQHRGGFRVPPRRDCLLALLILIAELLYFPLNQRASHPHVLTTALDHRLPLLPIFAAPYLIFLPVFWLTVVWSFLTGRGFLKLAITVLLVAAVSDIVYAVYPTYMPRPHHITGAFAGLLRDVYSGDNPYNDFPSGHNSSAVILTLYVFSLADNRVLRVFAPAFGLTVIAATMVIQQHSIIGAAGGILLAVAGWHLAQRVLALFQARVQQQNLHDNRKGDSRNQLRNGRTLEGPDT